MNKPLPGRRFLPAWLLLLAWLWGTPPACALPVHAVAVRSSSWVRQTQVMGTVESIGRATLTAPVTGRVLGPFPLPGNVAAGTVLARIAPPGLHAGIRAAQARVAYARAQMKRAQELFHEGVMARQDVDRASLALAEARSSLRELQAQAGEQVLTAPFSGTLHYLVPPGAVVNTGDPIATLEGRGQPWARAYVTPAQAQGLRPGTQVTITAQNWQGQGSIRSVGQSARHLGLVTVYIMLPAASPLLPGEWVQLTLSSTGGSAFLVPSRAVVMRGARSQVFVVRQGHAIEIPIRVMASEGDKTWVQGALRDGELVVILGNARLAPGVPVELMPVAPQP